MEHIKQLLTALNVPEDKIKAVMELPAEKVAEFKPDEIVTFVRANTTEQIRNDPEFWKALDEKNVNEDFRKRIETAQYGRAANIARTNILKATGLKEDDFKELGEEGKKLDVFIPAVMKKLTDGKVTDKTLQEQLIKVNEELEKLKTEAPTNEQKIREEYTGKMTEEKFDFIVLSRVAATPGLKVPAHYVSDKIAAQLKEENNFVVSGTRAELRQKVNKELKVLDNGKEVTLDAAIQKILKADGLIDEKVANASGGGGNKGTVEVDVQGNPTGLQLGHVSGKVNQRLQEEKASSSAK